MGLLVDEEIAVPNAPDPPVTFTATREPVTLQRIKNHMNAVSTAHVDTKAAFEDLVVRIPAAGYGTMEFDMTEERRNALIEAGRHSMGHYLDRWDVKPVTREGNVDEVDIIAMQSLKM